MHDRLQRALSRSDLSQFLIHLTKDHFTYGNSFDVLRSILSMRKVEASKVEYLVRYDQVGAACFYDVPPQNWQHLVSTNPNGRKGYGIIVDKTDFWLKGGRPVIYTDYKDLDYWPILERYRLSYLNLSREPNPPSDWTHEREWRFRGDFILNGDYWCPCVEKLMDANSIFCEYKDVYWVYILELSKFLERKKVV